jgi:hypothetical protein
MAAHGGGGVWFGDEWGLEERSRKPSIPSARKRATHLATVFGVVRYRRATVTTLSPSSTTARTIDSRPFGVRSAFLWLFIGSPESLKLRNLSFPGQGRVDNLLKAHT